MNVVVWQSYGAADVYAASTSAQLESVIRLMIKEVDGWGFEEKVSQVESLIKKAHEYEGTVQYAAMKKAFSAMVDAIDPGSHEAFEKIEIVTVKEA